MDLICVRVIGHIPSGRRNDAVQAILNNVPADVALLPGVEPGTYCRYRFAKPMGGEVCADMIDEDDLPLGTEDMTFDQLPV